MGMRTKNFVLVSGASLGADYDAPPIDFTIYFGASIQASWTGGSASGTLQLQYSNDGVVWTPDPDSVTTISGPGNYMWNNYEIFYSFIQVTFTRTSGTGSLKLVVTGKTV